MKLKRNKYKLLAAVFSLFGFIFSFLFASPQAHAAKWKLHPAFDNSPIRIVDTPSYTFFQVFQKEHSTLTATYEEPVAAGFVYLKSDPSRGIVPVSECFPVDGSSVRGCEYSPEGKFLVILRLDGGIDIVADNGTVTRNGDLQKMNHPGWSTINSMTLSGTEIWIATGGGYMVVDGSTGATVAIRDLGCDIARIARCGSRVVALSGGALKECVSKSFPASESDFKSLSLGSPANPKLFLPAKGDGFIYLADRVSEGSASLNYAVPEGGAWTHRHVCDLSLPVVGNSKLISNPYEMNFLRNKEGWLVFTPGDLRQLKTSLSPSDAGFLTVIPTRASSDPGAGREISVAGSWDLSDCWTYSHRGKFAPGKRSDSVFLIDDSKALRPSAPAVAQSTHLIYTPKFGVVGVTYGYSSVFLALGNVIPPLVSACKDGRWSVLDAAFNRPTSADSDPELARLYESASKGFPFSNPSGISADPVNDNYVWMGSSFGGIAALNLSDPKSDPIHFGSADDPLAAYPGFKALLPAQSWKPYAATTVPSFDANGTLWMVFHDYNSYKAGGDAIRLYWLTASERSKILSSRNVEQAAFSGDLHIPGSQTNATMRLLALKHSSSRNKVLVYGFSSPSKIYRFDHKGTLNDFNDDIHEYITAVEDQYGSKWKLEQCLSIAEDPLSGEVWLGDYNTLIGFDPNGTIKDGVIKGRVLDVSHNKGRGNVFSHVPVYGVAFDPSGRMWVSTEGTGIWGISADRKEVVAHYMMADSDLPSDTAYGLVWNPASESLMISTAAGYAEVWPGLPGGNAVSGAVSVFPREVMPGYSGKLTVRGASPDEKITIRSAEGKEVAVLKCGPDGVTSWDFMDRSGKTVASGIYDVEGEFGYVKVAILR